jgi:hypothetical protein
VLQEWVAEVQQWPEGILVSEQIEQKLKTDNQKKFIQPTSMYFYTLRLGTTLHVYDKASFSIVRQKHSMFLSLVVS